jgi:hypothetical protein
LVWCCCSPRLTRKLNILRTAAMAKATADITGMVIITSRCRKAMFKAMVMAFQLTASITRFPSSTAATTPTRRQAFLRFRRSIPTTITFAQRIPITVGIQGITCSDTTKIRNRKWGIENGELRNSLNANQRQALNVPDFESICSLWPSDQYSSRTVDLVRSDDRVVYFRD